MSKVSVYMSSYNYASYLQEAIESVLRQTYADFELFIEDDASKDDSWRIIESTKDTRMRAHRNATNQNNKHWMQKVIMEMASGEYIAVHHSDNVWEPEKLQKQVDFLDTHPEIGAVFTNARIITESGEPLTDRSNFYFNIFEQKNRTRYAWLNYFFYHGNALCHPSVLIRKKCYEACGFYRDGLAQIPDLDMWIRLCMKFDIHVMPEKLLRYRVQSDEKFTSGSRPETRIRWNYENLQVLENYRAINNFHDMVRIFPHAKKYERTSGVDPQYILGRIALETSDRPTSQLFGLNLLFEAINDPVRAKTIEEVYGFQHKDFIALTKKCDIFSSAVASNALVFIRPHALIIPMFIRRVQMRIAPPFSKSYRILKKASNTLNSIFRSIKNKF